MAIQRAPERNETKIEIGLRIRKLRKDLGMTQDELAIAVGYKSRSSINKIENGERDITKNQIIEMANALHTTPEYLIGWTDEPTRKNQNTPYRRKRLQMCDVPVVRGCVEGRPTLEEETLRLPKEYAAEYAMLAQSDIPGTGIRKGSLILIRENTTFRAGDFLVVHIKDVDGFVVRKLSKHKRNPGLSVLSLEGEKDLQISLSVSDTDPATFHILGKIVGHVSSTW